LKKKKESECIPQEKGAPPTARKKKKKGQGVDTIYIPVASHRWTSEGRGGTAFSFCWGRKKKGDQRVRLGKINAVRDDGRRKKRGKELVTVVGKKKSRLAVRGSWQEKKRTAFFVT